MSSDHKNVNKYSEQEIKNFNQVFLHPFKHQKKKYAGQAHFSTLVKSKNEFSNNLTGFWKQTLNSFVPGVPPISYRPFSIKTN